MPSSGNIGAAEAVDQTFLGLQPFGKLKHNRIKDTPAARIIVAKIRQPKANAISAMPGKEPVADPQE